MTANVEGDFVVFLLGMRINRLWKIHKWLPVAMAMPRMLRELSQDPTSGYLGAESWFGNPTILLQYWRSFEDLDSYAKKNQLRAPARMGAAFNRAVGSGEDVGIWHETHRVQPGNC